MTVPLLLGKVIKWKEEFERDRKIYKTKARIKG